jgi:hypothetical protein
VFPESFMSQARIAAVPSINMFTREQAYVRFMEGEVYDGLDGATAVNENAHSDLGEDTDWTKREIIKSPGVSLVE